jgi:hypothetical protein
MTTTVTAGETFARAIAAKDQAALRAVLADTIDFQALTPGRVFHAATGTEAAVEVILGTWFARAQMDELCTVTAGRVADREHVAYRVRVHAGGDEYLIEQQAYYDIADDGRISWMRVLCSGYQPLPPA